MFRLIGFLTGAAMMVVVLAAVVDAPTRKRAEVVATGIAARVLDFVEGTWNAGDLDSRTAAGTQPGEREDAVVSPPTPREETPIPTTATPRDPVPPPVTAIPEDERHAHGPQRDTGVPSAAERSTGSAPARPPAGTFDSTAAGPGWEPVWRAFRSELSAKGFADQLERLTGQAYRVRRTSPWAYQVELRYTDDAERDALLREIQSSTGLGLDGASP